MRELLVLPNEGYLIFFNKKLTEKIELLAKPGCISDQHQRPLVDSRRFLCVSCAALQSEPVETKGTLVVLAEDGTLQIPPVVMAVADT